MCRRLALISLLVILTLSLTACWNYRGLDELAMVMGMSVDYDAETGMFKVSFEIADLANSSKESGIKSRLIDAEGTTVFEAARAAKRKLTNKLYFAHMSVVVVGEKMARELGIKPVTDWFIRDAEVRETIIIVVAKGTDGHALLSTEAVDQTIVSQEMQNIILEDNAVTASTVNLQMYEVNNVLNCTGMSLMLPAFSITLNHDKPAPEADGAAIFNGDKLVGFLSADETKYFLIAQGKAQGGILTISADGSDTNDTSLEISEGKSNISYEYKDGIVTMLIDTETSVYLAETMCDIDMMDEKQIALIENLAGEKVSSGIVDIVTNVQALYGDDILGLGTTIHKKNPRLWHTLRENWALIYPNVQVVVTSTVNIKNTATTHAKEVDIK